MLESVADPSLLTPPFTLHLHADELQKRCMKDDQPLVYSLATVPLAFLQDAVCLHAHRSSEPQHNLSMTIHRQAGLRDTVLRTTGMCERVQTRAPDAQSNLARKERLGMFLSGCDMQDSSQRLCAKLLALSLHSVYLSK